MSGVRAAEPAAEPADDVPDRIAVQQLALARVGPLGDGPGRSIVPAGPCAHRGAAAPRWRPGPLRRCRSGLPSGSSSRAAWVSGRSPAPSSRRIAGAVLLSSQPSTVAGRSGAWPGCHGAPAARDGCARPGRRAGHAVAAAAAHRGRARRADAAGLPAVRAGCARTPGPGRVQAEHSGWSRVPPRTGPVFPQREHRPSAACRPGTMACRSPWRSRTGASLPQIAQVSNLPRAGSPRTAGPPGARTLTGRRRPHPAQFFLVGRVGDQAVRSTAAGRARHGWRPPGRLRTGRMAAPGTWPRSCGTATARRPAGAGG